MTPDRGGGRRIQACGDAGKGEATGPGRMDGPGPRVGRGESAGQATGRGEEGSNRKRARRPRSSLPAGRASSGDPSAPWTDPDTQPRKNPTPAPGVLAIGGLPTTPLVSVLTVSRDFLPHLRKASVGLYVEACDNFHCP